MTDKKTAKETILELYNSEDLNDIAQQGCAAAVPEHHIYYEQTVAFYDNFLDEIIDLFEDTYGLENWSKTSKKIKKQNDGDPNGYKNDITWLYIELIAELEVGKRDNQLIKEDLQESIKKDRESIKIAPDWYQVLGPDYAGPFRTEEEAKDKLSEFQIKYPNEKCEISKCRGLPNGTYFVGDPEDVINDFEDKEKWLSSVNEVFEIGQFNSCFKQGTMFALFKAEAGPGKYADSDERHYQTKSGYFIIFPLKDLDEDKCWLLVDVGKGHLFDIEEADVGYERQGDGCIDCGVLEIWTNEKV